MMNAAFGLRSVLDRRLQRGDSDAGVHRSADRVANHAAPKARLVVTTIEVSL